MVPATAPQSSDSGLVGVEAGAQVVEVAHEEATAGVEDLPDVRVADPVEDAGAGLASFDETPGAEDGELLGDEGRVDLEVGLEVGDARLAVAEKLEDADAGWVAQGLEQLGLVGS